MSCDVLLRARTLCLVRPLVVSLVLLPLRGPCSPFTSAGLRILLMRYQSDLVYVSSVIFLLWCGQLTPSVHQKAVRQSVPVLASRVWCVQLCNRACTSGCCLSSRCCVVIFSLMLGCGRVGRRYDATICLSALAPHPRVRFIGSTSYRSQSRSSLP